MSSSEVETAVPRAARVEVSETAISVELSDGRTVSVPTAWYPRLLHAAQRERDQWRLIGGGEGIHWPLVDEDVSVASLLGGERSGESRESLERWLAARGRGRP